MDHAPVLRLRRRRAAVFACFESAFLDAARRGSRLSRSDIALERFGLGFGRFPDCAARYSRAALLRVRAEACPFRGGFSFTPARRAFDNPMAIACFVDRAPCLPSRMCSISSCTNSPACVEGAFPSRLARRARSIVFFSGIHHLTALWCPDRPTEPRLSPRLS